MLTIVCPPKSTFLRGTPAGTFAVQVFDATPTLQEVFRDESPFKRSSALTSMAIQCKLELQPLEQETKRTVRDAPERNGNTGQRLKLRVLNELEPAVWMIHKIYTPSNLIGAPCGWSDIIEITRSQDAK